MVVLRIGTYLKIKRNFGFSNMNTRMKVSALKYSTYDVFQCKNVYSSAYFLRSCQPLIPFSLGMYKHTEKTLRQVKANKTGQSQTSCGNSRERSFPAAKQNGSFFPPLAQLTKFPRFGRPELENRATLIHEQGHSVQNQF